MTNSGIAYSFVYKPTFLNPYMYYLKEFQNVIKGEKDKNKI